MQKKNEQGERNEWKMKKKDRKKEWMLGGKEWKAMKRKNIG
jgi:hypothetical protein